MLGGNVLVFDIETVPDVETGRRLFNLKDLSDEDVALAMRALRAQKTGKTDFLSHFQHILDKSSHLCITFTFILLPHL